MHQECQQPQGLLMSHDTTPGQTQTAGIALEVLTWDSHLAALVTAVEVDFQPLVVAVAVVEKSVVVVVAGELQCPRCRRTEKLLQRTVVDGGAAPLLLQGLGASMPTKPMERNVVWPSGTPDLADGRPLTSAKITTPIIVSRSSSTCPPSCTPIVLHRDTFLAPSGTVALR
jgi:hypothetical protein